MGVFVWARFPCIASRQMPALGADPSKRSGNLQGYPAHEKQAPPKGHHTALGIVLLWGPTGRLFVMSEALM